MRRGVEPSLSPLTRAGAAPAAFSEVLTVVACQSSWSGVRTSQMARECSRISSTLIVGWSFGERLKRLMSTSWLTSAFCTSCGKHARQPLP